MQRAQPIAAIHVWVQIHLDAKQMELASTTDGVACSVSASFGQSSFPKGYLHHIAKACGKDNTKQQYFATECNTE